jgi:hypothetical protein
MGSGMAVVLAISVMAMAMMENFILEYSRSLDLEENWRMEVRRYRVDGNYNWKRKREFEK